MISRRRRRRTLGPPATSCGGIRWPSRPCVESASACSFGKHPARPQLAAALNLRCFKTTALGQHKSCRVEIVCRMKGAYGKLHIILGDQDTDLDLGRRDN